ncbi:MAG: hypothetical protein JSU77_00265 [Fidelibacterota bacterium]|nr:MAG: hypothetical protein JSU77_00265 [Candidatus Neomarinimicrobiota bacterium]
MLNDVLLYIGSAIIIAWGIAHIVPTKGVIADFGDISTDNLRIITMEWIAEGLTLCFIGVLVLLTTFLGWSKEPIALIVYRTSAGMLVVLAVLSQLTGARTALLPMRLCPYVKTAVALLFFLGSAL